MLLAAHKIVRMRIKPYFCNVSVQNHTKDKAVYTIYTIYIIVIVFFKFMWNCIDATIRNPNIKNYFRYFWVCIITIKCLSEEATNNKLFCWILNVIARREFRDLSRTLLSRVSKFAKAKPTYMYIFTNWIKHKQARFGELIKPMSWRLYMSLFILPIFYRPQEGFNIFDIFFGTYKINRT